MLMRVDVLHRAWLGAKEKLKDCSKTHTVFLSPQGALLNAAMAKRLANEVSAEQTGLILVCGHYEGVDERFIEMCVDEQVSIGEYVLTGGELPAMVLVDALARFIPGVVGKSESVLTDSFENGVLKYPQYTRPETFEGKVVPKILLSGNHLEIKKWRDEMSRKKK